MERNHEGRERDGDMITYSTPADMTNACSVTMVT